jgi:hypothetical protein
MGPGLRSPHPEVQLVVVLWDTLPSIREGDELEKASRHITDDCKCRRTAELQGAFERMDPNPTSKVLMEAPYTDFR